MNFIVFLLVIGVGYCLYELHIIKEKIKQQGTIQKEKSEESQKQSKLKYHRLLELKGKQCELIFNDTYIVQTFKRNVKGIVKEVDEEWVYLEQHNKKEVGNVIRLTMIHEIRQIIVE